MVDLIKFRTWDSLENKMRYDIGVIEFNGFDNQVNGLAFNYVLDDTGYNEVDNSQSEYYDANCFELMQFTGLKDSNGTEIYEGDILKWNDFAGFGWSEERTGKVFYNSKECKIGLTGGREFYRIAQNATIIGNIYENKELMEEVEWNM